MPFGIESHFVRRIQESAGKYGGECTFKFSQVLDPVGSMIGKSKVTKGGICQALSEMWIVFHAHDRSLWNWLYPEGRLSTSALANVAYNFSYGRVKDGSAFGDLTDQDRNSELWFLQYGIRRRTDMVQAKFNRFVNGKMTKVSMGQRSLTEGARTTGTSRAGLGRSLGEGLVGGSMVKNMGLGDGTYRMIGIAGTAGAHCMCAFVGTDVAFFDPNFGEYWFPKRADFARWFGEFFWPKSFYDYLLSGSFALRDYARAVGAGAAEFTGKF